MVRYRPASREYIYRRRSCDNCTRPYCVPRNTRSEQYTWLDNAKCGCIHYEGQHIREKPIKKTKQLKTKTR